MRCEEFENRCHELLDDRRSLPSDSHLIAHSLQCDECAALLNSLETLSLGLETWEPPDLAPEFAQRVVEEACASPATPGAARSWQLVSAVPWIAAAAALLLTVWLARPPRQLAPAPSGLAVSPTPVDASDLDGDLMSGIRDAWAQVPAEDLDGIVQALDDAARPLTDVARPITNSFGSTWTALRKTIPVRRDKPGAPLGHRFALTAHLV